MSSPIIITILATVCVKFGCQFSRVFNLELMTDPKFAARRFSK
jgi:hypothetical protein